jgi:hypothetical protein
MHTPAGQCAAAHSADTRTPLPGSIRDYAAAVAAAAEAAGSPLTSVVVFGSVVTGGYAAAVSDVDMVLVVPDGTDAAAAVRLRSAVEAVEAAHGYREAGERPGTLDMFARRITANVRSFFICTRADVLSGDVRRVLGISRAQAAFVDGVVLPSIVLSGTTAWGEDLLDRVPLRPLRRFDVAKAFFGLFNQALLCVALYPFVPAATKYAMDALKRSIHNCYFCHHLRPAALAEEVDFFRSRLNGCRALDELMELRRSYRRSLPFILRCLPALARLHARTARDVHFPRDPRRDAAAPAGAHDAR